MRWIFILAGLVALGASGYMAIMASGGAASASTPGTVAIIVVLAVGAAAIGHALAGHHIAIAVVIGFGMVAGEAGAMLQTAQRISAAREAMRAPITAIAIKRRDAVNELARAEAAEPTPADRSRLDAAERTKNEADKAARDKSAEQGCRQNCRLLLQAAVDNAAREVEKATAELAVHDAGQALAIAKRVNAAKSTIAALPPQQSATPLADNLGWPEWLLDLFEALALSLAINLPASALIALGVKMGSTRRPLKINAVDVTMVKPKRRSLVTSRTTPRDALGEAERFGLDMLRPERDARLLPGELRAAYLDWCLASSIEPLPMSKIAPALGMLFRKAGITVEEGAAIGVALKTR